MIVDSGLKVLPTGYFLNMFLRSMQLLRSSATDTGRVNSSPKALYRPTSKPISTTWLFNRVCALQLSLCDAAMSVAVMLRKDINLVMAEFSHEEPTNRAFHSTLIESKCWTISTSGIIHTWKSCLSLLAAAIVGRMPLLQYINMMCWLPSFRRMRKIGRTQ